MAQSQLLAFQAEIAGGKHSNSPATVTDLLTEYVAHLRGKGRAATTIHELERTRDKVLGPIIGHIKLSELKARHLDLCYRQLAEGDSNHRPQAPSSIQRYHAVLTAALSLAVIYEWINENPAEKSTGRPELTELVLSIPSVEQVQQYLAAAREKDECYWMLTLLAILTAARRGEYCDLRWIDLDASDGGVVRIRRSLFRAGKARGESVTKGKRERWVPINVELASILVAWRERCEKVAADVGVELVPDAFIVSRWPDGSRPINPDTLSSFQGRLAKDLEIKLEGRNPFRHFGATEILGSGASPRDGADILGHADVKTFLQRYTHATGARQRQAAAVLGRVLQLES